jgi:hypothetical protein
MNCQQRNSTVYTVVKNTQLSRSEDRSMSSLNPSIRVRTLSKAASSTFRSLSSPFEIERFLRIPVTAPVLLLIPMVILSKICRWSSNTLIMALTSCRRKLIFPWWVRLSGSDSISTSYISISMSKYRL